VKNLISQFSKQWKLLPIGNLSITIRSFSMTEKVIFFFFVCIFIITGLSLLTKINARFLVEVPDYGGNITEGVLGTPRFVNPLLATSDADRDLVALIYSGLMKAHPEDGLIPDLAESFTISPDGLTYSFILKEDVRFHDGTKITTDDIEFTISKAKDPILKSPRRGSWDGVNVEKVSDKEIHFVLQQPYAPFLENTTIGILPKHVWEGADTEQFSFSQLNIEPIGSGPYKVNKVKRNSAGIPTNYTLQRFSEYALGKPFIKTINVRFYQNEDELLRAYKQKDIESARGFSARTAHELGGSGIRIETAVLPRIFGVFFNQNQATIFTNPEVRKALSLSLDKEKIVSEILFGYGVAINSPIPIRDNPLSKEPQKTEEERFKEAGDVLLKEGWEKNEDTGIWEYVGKNETLKLSFSIATGDALEIKSAGDLITENWKRFGADVSIEVFETGNLNQNIIRPRKYDALFFGEIVGRDLDLYPFWHSSQRNDPGLNIALYVNSTVDSLVEKARKISDPTLQQEKLAEFEAEIIKDNPAVFVYSPKFIYVVPNKVKGMLLGQLSIPAERFTNINEWYVETNHIWKIFNTKKNQ